MPPYTPPHNIVTDSIIVFTIFVKRKGVKNEHIRKNIKNYER